MRPGIDAADRARVIEWLCVSRETVERLDIFVAELDKWRSITNLISAAAWPSLWSRHIADSAQLLKFAPHGENWADLGSGAGFPGLVIAILLGKAPDAIVHLVESDKRKTAFLIQAARLVSAPVKIHGGRIDAILPALSPTPEFVTARALAPLATLIDWTKPLLKRGSVGLFLKGHSVQAELTQVPRLDKYTLRVVASQGMHRGCIVSVALNSIASVAAQ